jgi:C_GCAxxG_C_C family probable redox protein
VLLGLKEELGLDTKLIPRIATPFGGGIARRGGLCGVASGALMAVGILAGRDDPGAGTDPAFEAAGDFLDGFEKKFGSLTCRALTGYDLSDRGELKAFLKSGAKEKICAPMLEWAMSQIEPLIPRED